MKILVIRTDKAEAEVGIFKNGKETTYHKWTADRQLAELLNQEVEKMLNKSSIHLEDLNGIVVYKGPGSFTGLRIGISAANAYAYALKIPIVSANGGDWIQNGLKKLSKGYDEKIALPKYDRPATTTTPRK